MAASGSPPDSHSYGLSDVQLSALVVQGLFGKYTHKIPLPTSPGNDSKPSVLILYGLNGVGKTTVLRMLDGLIRLDFNVFREVPFESCYLELSTGARLLVRSRQDGLLVTFEEHEVFLTLDASIKGAKNPEEQPRVEKFRRDFFASIANISFNFVNADRARLVLDDSLLDRNTYERVLLKEQLLRRSGSLAAARRPLGERVRQFIQEAQLDSPRFFGSSEPDLFSRIMEDLSHVNEMATSVNEIRETLELVHNQDNQQRRLGLRTDAWDYQKLIELVSREEAVSDSHSLAVLSTYSDFLGSRSIARQLLADRLLTFEKVMSNMYLDKTVLIDAVLGLQIVSNEVELSEQQLSSGEYQMLYLMVAALTTHRKGTVLAIDEPELSMHPSWQRKLVRSLVECASRAAPQIILATHSPDVSMDYSEFMVELVQHHSVG